MEGGEAYWVGKAEAERLAWEMAGAAGLEPLTAFDWTARAVIYWTGI